MTFYQHPSHRNGAFTGAIELQLRNLTTSNIWRYPKRASCCVLRTVESSWALFVQLSYNWFCDVLLQSKILIFWSDFLNELFYRLFVDLKCFSYTKGASGSPWTISIAGLLHFVTSMTNFKHNHTAVFFETLLPICVIRYNGACCISQADCRRKRIFVRPRA